MCQLLKYWGRLESRTKQVIDLLKFAAVARCETNEKKDGDRVPSRAERKMREKQKKALSTVEDLIERGSDSVDDSSNRKSIVNSMFYEPICELLLERAKMRSLWLERQNDGVFHSMPADYKPLPVPLHFGVSNPSSIMNVEVGISPLGGTAEELLQLTNNLKKSCKAYISQRSEDLPEVADMNVARRAESSSKESETSNRSLPSSTQENTNLDKNGNKSNECKAESINTTQKGCEIKQVDSKGSEKVIQHPITTQADHRKDPNWKAWNSINVGLEMQEPWAALLLKGTKTIETRAYDIPKALIGKKIDILESKRGKDGFSSIPNILVGEECETKIKRLGWCVFDRVIMYRYKAKFEADESKHLVKPESNYGWKDDTKIVYGWVVSKCGKYKNGKKKKGLPKRMKCAVRRMRSLFEIET